MIQQAIYPTFVSYNKLISLFANLNQSDRALVVFNHIKDRGLVPDLFLYRIMIEMFTQLDQKEQVQVLYHEMKHQQGIHSLLYALSIFWY